VGVPAVFGMNFQSVSTAQKLPLSAGNAGGYRADGTPGPVLSSALDFINTQVGAMLAEINAQHLDGNTTVILSAKHGQSPTDPSALTRIPDGPILDGLNAAWSAAHPGATALIAQATNDDAMIMWLSDHSAAAATFAKDYLLGHDGTGNDINGKPKVYTRSGVQTMYAGVEAAKFFGSAPGDPAVPDIYAVGQHGVVYTGGTKKIAEHGGADPQDRNVPLVISGAGAAKHTVHNEQVQTTQIAPTILALLGLNPHDLQAVQAEQTPVLPLMTATVPAPPADLAVNLQGVPLLVNAGTTVTATVTVTNNGPGDAETTVIDVLAPAGWHVAGGGGSVGFTATSVSAGQTVSYPVRLQAGGQPGIGIGAVIAVSSTSDPNWFNNIALTASGPVSGVPCSRPAAQRQWLGGDPTDVGLTPLHDRQGRSILCGRPSDDLPPHPHRSAAWAVINGPLSATIYRHSEFAVGETLLIRDGVPDQGRQHRHQRRGGSARPASAGTGRCYGLVAPVTAPVPRRSFESAPGPLLDGLGAQPSVL